MCVAASQCAQNAMEGLLHCFCIFCSKRKTQFLVRFDIGGNERCCNAQLPIVSIVLIVVFGVLALVATVFVLFVLLYIVSVLSIIQFYE